MKQQPQLFDASVILSEDTWVWPGDIPFRRELTSRLERTKNGVPTGANASAYSLSAHLGTHVDAPLHVGEGTLDTRQLPLEVLIGPCQVVSGPWGHVITAAELCALPVDLAEVRRLILHTGAGDRAREAGHFAQDYPVMDPGAAELLAASGVQLVGLDAPSVDAMESESLPTHHVLARRGVIMLEGLCLAGIPDGTYELIALPLAIHGGDGSPVRAVLRATT